MSFPTLTPFYGGKLQIVDFNLFPKPPFVYKPPVLFEPFPTKVTIDTPHCPWGQHVDVVTPLAPEIPAAQKIRIGSDGEILSNELCYRGGFKINLDR